MGEGEPSHLHRMNRPNPVGPDEGVSWRQFIDNA